MRARLTSLTVGDFGSNYSGHSGPKALNDPDWTRFESITMPTSEDSGTPASNSGAQFAATSWTVVMAAKQTGSPGAGPALEKLCETYWYPLYAYVRRKGYDPDKAQDLTQEFL